MKASRTFLQETRTKISNQKYEDQTLKMKRKEDMRELFVQKRKEGKNHRRRQTAHQRSSRAALGGWGRGGASNEMVEQHIFLLEGVVCPFQKARASPTRQHVMSTSLHFFIKKLIIKRKKVQNTLHIYGINKKILCVNTKSLIKLDWRMKPKKKSIIQKNIIKRMKVKMRKKHKNNNTRGLN